MLKKKYAIQAVSGDSVGGWWDSSEKRFRGYVFAEFYDGYDTALLFAKDAIKVANCTIIEILYIE